MHQFASGWKRNYYGKGDVIVYRLNRGDCAVEGGCPVFGANVTMLVYGEAFWPTYTTGNNKNLVATDSMKNFIQRETLAFTARDLESYCQFLAEKFLRVYPQTEGVQVSASEIPYTGIVDKTVAFVPSGPERATAQIELRREASALRTVAIRSGIQGFKLFRLGGSSFQGFVRDQYTTLPDITDRPLHMWLDVEWLFQDPNAIPGGGKVTKQVRQLVYEVFQGFESGSIQQVIYQIGAAMLAELPAISEVYLEANNRTWDTVAEHGKELGVYTDPRPPYGCLGLNLRR